MSRDPGCDRCAESDERDGLRRENAALRAERDALRAQLDALGEPETERAWATCTRSVVVPWPLPPPLYEPIERTVYRSLWRPASPATEEQP